MQAYTYISVLTLIKGEMDESVILKLNISQTYKALVNQKRRPVP